MTAFSTRRCWTREEYYKLAERGIIGPEERLELIEGEIIRKMAPMLTPHATGIRAVEVALLRTFPTGYDVRVQLPLALGPHNEPEPDVYVVTGSFRDYETAHPTTALLVVEIADSSLESDRATKSAIYARADIAEYWILNLPDRLLEVHRQPAPMSEMPLGFGYRSIQRLTESETVTPLAAPQTQITVADLLPRAA